MIAECQKGTSQFNISNEPNFGNYGAYVPVEKQSYDVADIFRAFEKEYHLMNNMPKHVNKVVNSIINCRTEPMGYHTYICDECDYEVKLPNSYCNRHCPKCQGIARIKWFDNRKKDVLPVDYFHVVFTLPNELEPIAFRNKKVIHHFTSFKGKF